MYKRLSTLVQCNRKYFDFFEVGIQLEFVRHKAPYNYVTSTLYLIDASTIQYISHGASNMKPTYK